MRWFGRKKKDSPLAIAPDVTDVGDGWEKEYFEQLLCRAADQARSEYTAVGGEVTLVVTDMPVESDRCRKFLGGLAVGANPYSLRFVSVAHERVTFARVR